MKWVSSAVKYTFNYSVELLFQTSYVLIIKNQQMHYYMLCLF
jgi:hypothetical protein